MCSHWTGRWCAGPFVILYSFQVTNDFMFKTKIFFFMATSYIKYIKTFDFHGDLTSIYIETQALVVSHTRVCAGEKYFKIQYSFPEFYDPRYL